MRGLVAKKLRNRAYGDRSRRLHKYEWRTDSSERPICLVCIGDRANYLRLKRNWKLKKKGGELVDEDNRKAASES